MHSGKVATVHLIALAVAVAVGAVGFVVLNIGNRHAIESRGTDIARLTLLVQNVFIEDVQRTLRAIAEFPEVKSGDVHACETALAAYGKLNPRYASFGVVSPNGDVWCNSLFNPEPGSIADRSYFRRALETKDFAIGDYQLGRITGERTINGAVPVIDPSGRITQVVFAALRISFLAETVESANLPDDFVLTVIDDTGTIIVRYPGAGMWVGSSLFGTNVGDSVLAHWEGVLTEQDIDGVRRSMFFTPLFNATEPHGYLHVIVGMRVISPLERPEQLITLGTLALAAYLLVLFSFLAVKHFLHPGTN